MVCWMVGLPVLSPAKTAEPIEIPFGFWVGQRNHVLDGLYGPYVLVLKNAQLNCLSVCGGNAAFEYIRHSVLVVLFFIYVSTASLTWLV